MLHGHRGTGQHALKMTGQVLLCLLCLLACIPGGMLLTEEKLARVTEYIKDKITSGYFNFQHAYAVKFTSDECKYLSNEDIEKALRQEDIDSLRETVRDYRVYEGPRMVASSYSQTRSRLHAEYRLLHGERGVSPIQNLMNKLPAAGCIVFFTLNSPCLSKCVNTEYPSNIINDLSVFNKVNEAQRAFVFRNVYYTDKETTDDEIWAGWRTLNERITLFNCKNGICRRCFIKPVRGKENLPVQQCLHP